MKATGFAGGRSNGRAGEHFVHRRSRWLGWRPFNLLRYSLPSQSFNAIGVSDNLATIDSERLIADSIIKDRLPLRFLPDCRVTPTGLRSCESSRFGNDRRPSTPFPESGLEFLSDWLAFNDHSTLVWRHLRRLTPEEIEV